MATPSQVHLSLQLHAVKYFKATTWLRGRGLEVACQCAKNSHFWLQILPSCPHRLVIEYKATAMCMHHSRCCRLTCLLARQVSDHASPHTVVVLSTAVEDSSMLFCSQACKHTSADFTTVGVSEFVQVGCTSLMLGVPSRGLHLRCE